jgi:hypothetical protein
MPSPILRVGHWYIVEFLVLQTTASLQAPQLTTSRASIAFAGTKSRNIPIGQWYKGSTYGYDISC